MAINLSASTKYLEGLYKKQLSRAASDYLQAHSMTRGGILRQITAAKSYLPYVCGRVLDWGCFHAPDACLIRNYWGSEVELYGCDIHPPDSECFAVFHQAAELQYKKVEHPYHIPYDDAFFDTVIADGVLEHVPNDLESLKELFRILKPDGLLVVSCLPNSLSYLETLARWFHWPHHLRSYTMSSIRKLLLHSGFQPINCRYFQMMPTLSGLGMINGSKFLRVFASLLWKGNTLLEAMWPLNKLASNLFLLARKRQVISWHKSCFSETPRTPKAA